MRNKFMDWVKDGIATFSYHKDAKNTPTAPDRQDPICKTYNNFWGAMSDTHMHGSDDSECCDPGSYYITGSKIDRYTEWEQFVNSCRLGGMVWKEATGYCSLCDFFLQLGLDWEYTKLNGQTAIIVHPKYAELPKASIKIKSYTTSESQIPCPISELENSYRKGEINVLASQARSFQELAESMNKNPYIKGNNWKVYNGQIISEDNQEIIFLQTSYKKYKEVNIDDIKESLDDTSLKLYQLTGGGFVVGSSKRILNECLLNNPQNNINEKKFEDQPDSFWIDQINYIYNAVKQ